MQYQECKIVIILLLTLLRVLLLCSQDAGLTEFIPRDARLLRSQAEESSRRDRAEHWQEMPIHSAAITVLILAQRAWQQMFFVPWGGMA